MEDTELNDIIILSSGITKDNYDLIDYDYDKVVKNLSHKDMVILRDPFVLFLNYHPNYCNILLKNLENVKIKKSRRIKTDGSFSIDEKFCKYNYSMDSRYHELLHMASSFYDEDKCVVFYGFYYNDLISGFEIGYGLNEGYTSYLEDKEYCFSYSLPNSEYWMADLFARKIELIIGKEKMEEYYFCGDLNGLIDELRNYLDYEEVIDLLNAIDCSVKSSKTSRYYANEILEAQEILRKIVIDYFPEKLKEFEKNLIDFDDNEFFLSTLDKDLILRKTRNN